MKRFAFFLIPSMLMVGCHNTPTPVQNIKTADDVPVINFTVVKRLPHDPSSFTEGFLFHNDQLFESTGSPQDMPQTKSLFGVVNVSTGKIDAKVELNRDVYFGEGIVFLKNKVYQLTYKNQLCFVYDAKTFKKVGQFSYSNKEGWGLTTDGTNIIMSDGTYTLSFIDPDNFKVVKTLQVSANSYAIDNLNELEYIKGFIYANVWTTNKIVKIDPATGQVVGKMDLTPLKEEAYSQNPGSSETNGIAYDAAADKIYVTGKMWPVIFQISLP